MGLFGKKDNDETKCNKCDLEFSSSERLERHTEKAHGKNSKTQIKKETWGSIKTRNRKNRNVGSGYNYLSFTYSYAPSLLSKQYSVFW